MAGSTYRVGEDPDEGVDGPLAPDEVFAPPSADERESVSAFDSLRTALAAPTEQKPVFVKVLSRPGVELQCHTRVDHDDRKAWQKRSKGKRRGLGGDTEVDEMKFAQLVIANTCEAVLMNGVAAYDGEGTPLTFRHRQLLDMVSAADAPQAIRNLFDNDAHVLLASGEILVGCGFDDDVSSDPTERGSGAV